MKQAKVENVWVPFFMLPGLLILNLAAIGGGTVLRIHASESICMAETTAPDFAGLHPQTSLPEILHQPQQNNP